MLRIGAALVAIVAVGLVPDIHAQSAQSGPSVSVPRVISVTGVYLPADGTPAPAGTVLTLVIYADEQGGAPLWQETQNIALDKAGRFTLLLGLTQPDGIPLELFASGEARWLGMHFAGPGETERPRTRLTSVPYALRASDADTLGGKPASAYLLAPTDNAAHPAGTTASTSGGTESSTSPATTANVVQAGTPNFLAKYVNSADVGTSAVYENGGAVGIGTTTPFDSLHVRFTNTTGSVTGYAVQNLGNTATSYSGMLFYDQNGALGQFQGFNNLTHEYRINNIAQNLASQYNGSINFMIGNTSKFFVSPVGVGIGTTAPASTSNLDVSNAVSNSGATNINITQYGANGFGGNLIGKKARGTEAAPSAVLNNDGLLTLSGTGYGATGFAGASSGVITMRASENWTDTAHGSYMTFATTANGTTGNVNRMTINANGNVGIGVSGAQAGLEVSNQNGAAGAGTMLTTTFTNAGSSQYAGRRARGTGFAPTAVQNGDALVSFVGEGYGTTGFSNLPRGGMFVGAAENWTDAAQGTNLTFLTTPTGTNVEQARMTIAASGNVGIGTPTPGSALEVSRTGDYSVVTSTAYANGTGASSFFVAQTARGTAAAPTAVQTGDFLGGFAASGYGTTSFNDVFAVVAGFAAENFTDTARGSGLAFATTPLGTKDAALVMGILPSGSVGIGTPFDVNGLPTATDKLQVFGDVRVGTSGTNGCIKNFAGTGIIGTCSSDRRLKKNITPFGPSLDKLTALQPVHFDWRAAEFPERHFGDSRAYGLIAQDVEAVLPELVVTDKDGFKAVDYTKLPLLTIQAVRELKAENDDLKERVAALERLIKELRSSSTRD